MQLLILSSQPGSPSPTPDHSQGSSRGTACLLFRSSNGQGRISLGLTLGSTGLTGDPSEGGPLLVECKALLIQSMVGR